MKKILKIAPLVALVAGFALVLGNRLSDRAAVKSDKKLKKINIEAAFSAPQIIPIVIIGSGPAGLSAGTYGARSGMHTVVLQGDKPGGLLTETSAVENYPGYTSVMGPELVENMREQAEQLGAQFLSDTVESVDFSSWPYKITTEDGRVLHAMSVIWATGAAPRRLGVPGEEKYWGTGVTSCAVCDAPFFKGEEVVVIGGGDSAVEEAIQLSSFAKKITILVRKDRMRAAASMQERLKGYNNISIKFNVEVRAIVGDDMKVTGIELYDNKEKTTEIMPISGVFLAIGHDPNTQLLRGKVAIDDEGYIKLRGRSQATSVPGVFAAGDVEDSVYRQAGVAAGSGIKAALDAVNFLGDIGFNAKIEQEIKPNYFTVDKGDQESSITMLTTVEEVEALISTAKGLVIIDFYADYCPSCMHMLPIFETVAGEYTDATTFAKVDVDQAPEVAEKLMVQKIPCLLVYKNGNLLARYTSTMNKKELTDFVDELLQEE